MLERTKRGGRSTCWIVYLEGGATAAVGSIRVGSTGQEKFGHRLVTFLSGCKQKKNRENEMLIDPAEEDPVESRDWDSIFPFE